MFLTTVDIVGVCESTGAKGSGGGGVVGKLSAGTSLPSCSLNVRGLLFLVNDAVAPSGRCLFIPVLSLRVLVTGVFLSTSIVVDCLVEEEVNVTAVSVFFSIVGLVGWFSPLGP
jgi:hypothetical protein